MTDAPTAADAAKTGTKPMNPTVRMIATIFGLITKFGPGIVTDLGSLFAIFKSTAPATATAATSPSVVNFVGDLHAAAKGGSTVTPDHVGELADKHGIDLTDAEVAEVHKLAA